MSDVEPGPDAPPAPEVKPIRPIETALAIAAFLLLSGNVIADWQSADYGGGMVSIGLIVLIGAILGKNMGSLVGGGR